MILDSLNTLKEDFMKKSNSIFSFCLLAVFLSLTLFSCGQKERVTEKQMIQISPEELQEKNVAVYKTRELRGKEEKYLSFLAQ